MEYVKSILAGLINLCILFYIACGLGVLAFITVLLTIFCWSDTISTFLRDCYTDVSKALKELF